MKRLVLSSIFISTCLFSTLKAQDDSQVKNQHRETVSKEFNVRINKVRDSIFVLTGKGGNMGLLVGQEGAVLIDCQLAEATTNILNAVSNLNSSPIQFLINTNFSEDKIGGIKNLRQAGVITIAHENVRKNLVIEERKRQMDSVEKRMEMRVEKIKQDNRPEGKEMDTKSAMAQMSYEVKLDPLALPMVTFSENLSLFTNNEEIEIYHLPNAQSNGNAIVYFKTTNVLHVGDAFVKDQYPVIDVEHGGSYEGYTKGLATILSLINDKTLIIPSHGPIASLADVRYAKSMMDYVTNSVAYHRVDKKTEEEVIAMKDITKEFDEKGYGDVGISRQAFIQAIYREAARKHPWNNKKK